MQSKNKPIQLRASTAGFTALQNCQKCFQLILTVEQLRAVLTAHDPVMNFKLQGQCSNILESMKQSMRTTTINYEDSVMQ